MRKVQVVAWHQTGNNQLIRPMMTQFTDDHMDHIINSLAPGRFDCSLKFVNFKLISMIDILSIFCEIAIRWVPQHLTDH